jgi:L-amino acid N-acyltransferase YncA
MSKDGSIRLAVAADAPAIIEIYRPHIEASPVSFEVEVPSVAQMCERIAEYQKIGPWYVYEVGGVVAGYAYASKHRERKAYDWTVEVSVYIDKRFRHQGIGAKLYGQLLLELKNRGYHLALAGITLPNDASIGFHESCGFEKVGVYREVGFKLGRWHDVGWWQKILNSSDHVPMHVSAR